MSEHSFDVIVRRAAGIGSRRATLLTLGTAGVAALAHPLSTQANKNKNKKKSDRKEKKQCKNQLAQCTAQAAQCATQVEQCNTSVRTICAGDPICTERMSCCPFLGNCDVNAFLSCVGSVGVRRVP